MGRQLGKYLRDLRHMKDIGIKQVAPELDLSYSYLSKLENGLLEPSMETVRKLAEFYGVDAEVLGTLAGKLPADVVAILEGQPEAAIRLLRSRFAKRR
jgi:transcriptional regulator with XRE-family HTH domain